LSRGILRLRSVRAALVVAAVAGVALCFSPLLGAPGIESALVLGLLLPPFAGAIGARVVDAARASGERGRASSIVADALSAALLVLGVPVALLVLDLVRVPTCAPIEGLVFLALGPGFAVVLCALVGVLIGIAIPRPRLATTLAVLVPFGAAGVELWGFYATPAIYAYGHFFGYFPGTIYDPDIAVTTSYVSFRAISAVWILALLATIASVWDPETHRAAFEITRARWRLALTALALAALAFAGWANGPALGHRSDADSIEEVLGRRIEGERCDVVVPREMPRADARRLADDCDFRVRRVEGILGVRHPRRVTAFFFRSSEEKRALMGASNTYIAKPWRDEVYLQVGEWPHPVLFHEIVHVVAGNVGVGPFRIAGGLGGIWPSPAIIEGTAVAVAWDAREGLTPHQWARAMLELDLAPPMTSVEGLGFLLQPAGRAYVASGSFVRWLLDTRGNAALRQLYATGDWEAALGRPLADAEADWHRFLREEVDLPEEARALAQLRFERPGIFGQICPHQIANLRIELGGDLAAGDDVAALERCHEILELDEGQAPIRATMVGALARLGRREGADEQLRTLEGPPSAATPILAAARQELADALWRRGQREAARDIYHALLEEPMSEDGARQIEVRVVAIEMGGAGERALRELLAPRRDRQNDPAVQLSEIARLDRARHDGLAGYLEGRQLLFRQRYELALPRLVDARGRGLPTDRMRVEARRMEAIARFGADDLEGSRRLWREIVRDESSSEGQRVEARDWLARVRARNP
jgi:hypothetical protein